MKRFASTMLVAAMCGCGGGGGSSTTPAETEAAKTVGGEAIRTAGGEAVLKKAHDRWKDAMAEFRKNEAEGWTPAACNGTAKAFERAAGAQDGGFAEAQYMAGLSLAKCNDEGAYDKYETALKEDSTFCRARVALGLRDLEQGRTAKARAAFERAVKDDPQCTSGYTNLAIIQRGEGGAQEEEALKNLRRALAIDSDYLAAFNQMALLHFERGKRGKEAQLDLAEIVCRQAQLIDPEYAPIYTTWGLIKVEKGDIIAALRFFEQALSLDPTLFEAQMNFGEVTISFRGYEDGRAAFKRAVQLRPNDYDAIIGLGTALRGLEQYPQAQAQYEKAKALDAGRPEAYFNLGVLYQDYMSGSVADLKTAQSYFAEFMKRAGKTPEFRSEVQSVSNRCAQTSSKKRGKAKCRPGRLQNIELSIDAMSVTG